MIHREDIFQAAAIIAAGMFANPNSGIWNIRKKIVDDAVEIAKAIRNKVEEEKL